MPGLFDPLQVRDLTLESRIVVSPMCQYSSTDGFATDWHFVHLGSRAIGGAGLVFTEAAAVLPEARISPEDLGFWKDEHADQWTRIGRFVKGQGAAFGIQLAHAGRKASTYRPWDERRGMVPEDGGGWGTVGPSPIPFADGYPHPAELDHAGIRAVVKAFGESARRAAEAGFQVVEIHAAHGYLLQEFLSPMSNQRLDRYGGTFENRVRLLLEVVDEVRLVWPDRLPLFVRISATDWQPGGWTIEESVQLVRLLGTRGVDLVDCSSGGNVATAKVEIGPGYQTGFAERIRREAGVPTGAVGLITDPAQADHVIRSGQADLVILAREMLRHPYWPLAAARSLGVPVAWPAQYLRAAPAGSPRRRSGIGSNPQ